MYPSNQIVLIFSLIKHANTDRKSTLFTRTMPRAFIWIRYAWMYAISNLYLPSVLQLSTLVDIRTSLELNSTEVGPMTNFTKRLWAYNPNPVKMFLLSDKCSNNVIHHRQKYGISGKHSGNTHIWHLDLLEIPCHQSQTSSVTWIQLSRVV